MKSIQAMEKEIIDEFSQIQGIDEKYAHLFQLGEALPEMDASFKDETHQVRGCQSIVWFQFTQQEGRLYLQAESDSMVIKGVAALLVRLVNDRTPEELNHLNLGFIDQMKIWKLAAEKNNGLMAMLEHIQQQVKFYAENDCPEVD